MIAVIDASVIVKWLMHDPQRELGRGLELAMDLKQHLFDTYYHGVPLGTSECALVTADQRYLRAARTKGKIVDLMEWE